MTFSSLCFSYDFLLNVLIVLGLLLFLLIAVLPFILAPYFNRAYPRIAPLVVSKIPTFGIRMRNFEKTFAYCFIVAFKSPIKEKQIDRLNMCFDDPNQDYYSMMDIKLIHKIISYSYFILMLSKAFVIAVIVILLKIHDSEFSAKNFPEFTRVIKDLFFCQ